MKIIKLLLMIIVTLSVACIGCSKIDDETAGNPGLKSTPAAVLTDEESYSSIQTWTENFDAPLSLNNNWTLYGNPQPQWVQSAYGRNGLFDNNGPSPIKNFAVSELIIGNASSYNIEAEVMLKILNINGSCICPGIAVSKELNPVLKNGEIETGITMRIIFAGTNATWFPAKLRGHTWFIMEYINKDGITVSSDPIQADNYSNDWHKLKIIVTQLSQVRFYCDNILIWAPIQKVHPTLTKNKNVVLGYTSAGDPATSAGVAYHNWVKTSYFISPSIE
jgi:uncharacterized protein YceK